MFYHANMSRVSNFTTFFLFVACACVPVGVKAAVNRAAQFQFEAYGVLLDKRCEDFATGTPLPCDDAGIPGSGGSSAPCAIFTPEEAVNRLWPPAAVEALRSFLGNGPESWRSLSSSSSVPQ